MKRLIHGESRIFSGRDTSSLSHGSSSYHLTGSLSIGAYVTAKSIIAGDVTADLNGFSVSGPRFGSRARGIFFEGRRIR